MNPEDIGRILDEIGARIGPAGEYAWDTLVMGERIIGGVLVGAGVVAGAATFVLYRLGRWAYETHKGAGPYDSHDIGAVTFGIGCLTFFIAACALVGSGLPGLLAPEYVAIKQILGSIR